MPAFSEYFQCTVEYKCSKFCSYIAYYPRRNCIVLYFDNSALSQPVSNCLHRILAIERPKRHKPSLHYIAICITSESESVRVRSWNRTNKSKTEKNKNEIDDTSYAVLQWMHWKRKIRIFLHWRNWIMNASRRCYSIVSARYWNSRD